VSEAAAGPVHDAKRQPAEAQPARQVDAGGLDFAVGTGALATLGARGLPMGLLNRSERPAGRGLQCVQAAHVLHLQRVHGNRDVARLLDRPPRGASIVQFPTGAMLQSKLTVNAPGDSYEQDADRFADDVMRMPAVGFDEPPTVANAETPGVQRTCAVCTDQSLQRLPAAVDPIRRAEGTTGAPAEVPADVEARIERMRHGGQPLPDVERAFFEIRSGADLRGVRVHTDGTAAETARNLNARAYTIGSDIAFGAGEYQPSSDTGRRLIAHELAHVFQQRGAVRLTRAPAVPHGAAGAAAALKRADADAPAPAEGLCPVCGRQGKGRCSGCGEEFAPVRRISATTEHSPETLVRQAAGTPALGIVGTATGPYGAGPSVQRLGLDDVLSLGRDGAIDLIARFSPDLADFIRRGPMALLIEKIKSGVQNWLKGLLGGVNIGGAISGLVGSLSGAFAAIAQSPNPACATLAAALDGLRKLGEAIANNAFVKSAAAVFGTISGVFQKIADVVVGGAFDTVMGIVGDVTSAAKTVWGWILKAKDALGVAWDTVKKTIGLDDDENGLVAKLKAKAAEGWETIKKALAPAVGPIKTMLKLMLVFSPVGPTILIIKYLPELVETVQWLWAHKGDADIVKSSQASHPMLSKLLGAARGFGEAVQSVATALAKGATELHQAVLSVLGAITGVPLLSIAQGLMQSIASGVEQLTTLAKTGFEAAGKAIGSLYQKAKTALEPYIEVLLPLGMAVVNPAMIPVILAGKAWGALPDCYKEPIINFLLDVGIKFLRSAPNVTMFGPLWQVLKAGVIGFLEGVRARGKDEKVRITNKLAKIVSYGNPSFLIGYAKGLMIGLWKGLKQPFELAYDLIKLLNYVQTWAEKAGEQALTQALAPAAATAGGPAGAPPATAGPAAPRPPAPIAATTPAASAPAAPSPGVSGAASGGGQAAVQQKLNQMLGELRPPMGQVTTGFMPALQETFSGGAGITYADVKKKLGSLLADAETALQAKGNELAGVACKSFLNDKNDAQLGEDIGDVSGQVLFEVILLVLTEGLIEALKPLQGIAKLLDWAGEAFSAALKWLGKIGGWVIDGAKGLLKFVENSGIAKKVVKELEKIGEILVRYADELFGLGGKTAGREIGEEAAEQLLKEFGPRATKFVERYGDEFTQLLAHYGPDASKLSDDAIDGFLKWKKGLSAETQQMFADNPALWRAWTDMDPRARNLLTKCSSPCIPVGANAEEGKAILELINKHGLADDDPILKEYLYLHRGDLAKALDDIKDATDKADLHSRIQKIFDTNLPMTVTGTAAAPHEVAQINRFGRLEGGGSFEFLGNSSQGIEGFFTPKGSTARVPVSLKSLDSSGSVKGVFRELRSNAKAVQGAGHTRAIFYAEPTQFTTKEIMDFLAVNKPNVLPSGQPDLAGVFDRVILSCKDGIVVIDAAGKATVR
jgi:hypothetical protein